jgi:hypothetical protein
MIFNYLVESSLIYCMVTLAQEKGDANPIIGWTEGRDMEEERSIN